MTPSPDHPTDASAAGPAGLAYDGISVVDLISRSTS